MYQFGILAQLGEHLPYKQGVTGSSPVGPTHTIMYGGKMNTPMWLNLREIKIACTMITSFARMLAWKCN